MKYIYLFVFLGIIHPLWSQTTINYQASSLDFINPERGFYRYSETRASNYQLLNQGELEGFRQLNSPNGGNYSVYSSLVFRYFFLDDFKTSSITQSFLDKVQTDFNTARLAGVKLIPRFAYTNEVNASGCGSWICPPYGDASKAWVLTHINQLAPVLQANKDVIATVQLGFIGVWGENYYTDFFGDASQAPDYKLLDGNWSDRIEVLNAFLAAVPTDRMIQVRYPQKKQRAVYGINAPTTVSALTQAEAFLGTNKARIGFHNDCLLASPDDYGTYADYGNSSSNSNSDTTHLKPYVAADSKYVVVGGETCDDSFSPQNDCAASNSGAYGDTELARMHYSFLNADYNNDVNNDWQVQGCMETIKKRLGYRFELQDGIFNAAAQQNQVFEVALHIKNVGYASPYNKRGLEVILRNTINGQKWYAPLPNDPRCWFAGNNVHNITESLCIPSTMPLGNYEVLLNLPDPMPSLYESPKYAVRLANLLPNNTDVWESTTGYNKLGHIFSVTTTASSNVCNGHIPFEPVSAYLPVQLIDLSAKSEDKSIRIEWSTASEYQNEGFTIERSIDGKSFQTLAWKKGNGTTDALSSYAYLDNQVDENVPYYYRLAQMDFDGTRSYSKIVTARVEGSDKWLQFQQSISIFPNPTADQVSVAWDVNFQEKVQVQLYNFLGAQLEQVVFEHGFLDLSSLPAGIYYVKFKVGPKEQVRKVVKL